MIAVCKICRTISIFNVSTLNKSLFDKFIVPDFRRQFLLFFVVVAKLILCYTMVLTFSRVKRTVWKGLVALVHLGFITSALSSFMCISKEKRRTAIHSIILSCLTLPGYHYKASKYCLWFMSSVP